MSDIDPDELNLSPDLVANLENFENLTPEELHKSIDELFGAIINIIPNDERYDDQVETLSLARTELKDVITDAEQEAQEALDEVAAALLDAKPKTAIDIAVENLKHPGRAKTVRALLDNQHHHDQAIAAGVFPASRKIMGDILTEQTIADLLDQMIAFDLVSVQPMAGPVGLMYSMRYCYEPPREEREEEKVSFMESYVPFNDEIDITPKMEEVLDGTVEGKYSLNVISAAVEARSKKLSAGWTIEAQQDLEAQYGLDIEEEMRMAIVSEVALENDYEILMDLRHLAEFEDGKRTNGSRAASVVLSKADLTDKLAIQGKLGIAIHRASNSIAMATRRGAGNWMVVTPTILSILQTTGHIAPPMMMEGKKVPQTGLSFAGTFNGCMKVYVDPYHYENDILIGYKGCGSSDLDSGYFWAPYIPVMSSGVVVNPLTFQPVVSLMTRAGKYTFVAENNLLASSSDYYRLIKVTLPSDEEDQDTEEALSTEVMQELLTAGKEISQNIEESFKPMFTSNDDNIVIGGDSVVEDLICLFPSDGKGSKVESLDFLNERNELADLSYFQQKVFDGLRVPQNLLGKNRFNNEEEK